MRPPWPTQDEKTVARWNAKHPVGTPVKVRLDDGTVKETTTRSEAHVVCGRTALIFIEGISGSCLLCRVTPAEAPGK
jgi:hypothetical protein